MHDLRLAQVASSPPEATLLNQLSAALTQAPQGFESEGGDDDDDKENCGGDDKKAPKGAKVFHVAKELIEQLRLFQEAQEPYLQETRLLDQQLHLVEYSIRSVEESLHRLYSERAVYCRS